MREEKTSRVRGGYNTPAADGPGGRGETMITRNEIVRSIHKGTRLLRQEWRRVVAFMVAFTFTFTMTGLDAIIAHAYDDYKQYQGSKLEVQRDALMSGTNPADNAKPDAFVDVANPDSLNNPALSALSDTSMNVLKSEYGSLLDTVSLQTLSERAAGSMNMDALVNEMLGQPATGPQGQMSLIQPDQQVSSIPQVDPATMADIVTLQQGPLGMSLEMDNADPAQIQAGDNKDLARLPMPATAFKEDQPAVQTEIAEMPEQDPNAVVETPQTPDTQLATLPSSPDALQPNAVQTDNVRTEDQQLLDQNQVQLPEEKQVDQQNVVLPKDQQQADQGTDASQNGNLTQQFLALLGLSETPRTETLVMTPAGVQEEGETRTLTRVPEGEQAEVIAPADQGEQPQGTTRVEQPVQDDGEQLVRTEDTEQPQPEQQLAQNPDQQTDQGQPGQVLPGQDQEPGDDQEQKPNQTTNWTDQLKAFLGMDVTTPERVETGVVETSGAEDLALPEIPATNLVQTAEPQPDAAAGPVETDVPKVEVAAAPEVVEPEQDKKPVGTDTGEEEEKPEGEGQAEDEDLTDQFMAMLGVPAEDEGGPAAVDASNLDLDVTVIEIDLPAPEISATSVLGADTLQIDVNALMVDQIQINNDTIPVENETPAPALIETPRQELSVADLPLIQNDPLVGSQPLVQNTQIQQNDQLGICMVGPDTTLADPNQNQVPVTGDNEVQAASLVVQPDTTLRDPAQAAVNPLLATSPLNTNAGFTPISNSGNNLIASLPNALSQGTLITATQPINTTLQTAFTVPTVRTQIQPSVTATQPQLGMAPQTMPQMYDVNMQGMMLMGSSSAPAAGTIGTIVPAGTGNNIVTVATAAVQAASNPNSSIPPRPTFEVSTYVSPWTGNAPVDGNWDALANEYKNMYDHPDPPEEKGGGGSGCAKFFASPLGKILMFVVTVVLTIFTVGTAAPILLAIIIILEAVMAFVPLPPALAMTLGILCAFLGGWANGLAMAAGATTTTVLSISQAAVQAVIQNAGGLFNTLVLPAVAKAIIKAVIARVLVDVFLLLVPDASPIMTAFVALMAGMVAGGIAEFATGGSKTFGGAFLKSLDEMFGEAFSPQGGFDLGKFVLSPFARSLLQVVGEAAIVHVMKSLGYTDAYSQLVGSILSTVAVGAVMYVADPRPSNVPKVTALILVPTLSAGLSTYYSVYAAPLLREEGYSTIQTMRFARALGDFVNLFTPTVQTSPDTKAQNFTWKLDIQNKLEQLSEAAKNEKPLNVPVVAAQAQSSQTQQEQPQQQNRPTEPALDPKVQEGMRQGFNWADPIKASVGERLMMPSQGPAYMMPQLAMDAPMLRLGMTGFLPPETSPVMLQGGAFGTGGLYAGTGTMGYGGQGVMGAGVMPALGYTPGFSPNGMSVTSPLGSTSLNLYDSDVAPLRTNQVFNTDMPTQSAVSGLQMEMPRSLDVPTEAKLPAADSVADAYGLPDVQRTETSPMPKPSALPDAAGETSQTKPVQNDSRPEVNKQALNTNNQVPDATLQTQMPNQQQQQQPQTAMPEPNTQKPQEMPTDRATSDVRRDLSDSTTLNERATAQEPTQVKDLDLKQGDSVQRMGDKTPKGGEKNVTAAEAESTERVDVEKSNNQIVQNSGTHAGAFQMSADQAQQATGGASPQVMQGKSADAGVKPAAVQDVVGKLQNTGVLDKSAAYSYTQGLNTQGQMLTQVFNGQGQIVGAQTTLANGTTVTKVFDYQMGAAAGSSQVRATTYENNAVVQQQTMKIEGQQLSVIGGQTRGAMPDTQGLDKSQADKRPVETGERRDDAAVAAGKSDPTNPQGPGTEAKGPGTGEAGQTPKLQPGQILNANLGTPDKPINAQFAYDPQSPVQEVQASNGTTYRLAVSETGTVEIKGQFSTTGALWWKEQIYTAAGETVGVGSRGGVYDMSGGEPKLVQQMAGALYEDSQGKVHTLQAVLPVDVKSLPPDVQKAMVMLENVKSNTQISAQLSQEMATAAAATLKTYAESQPIGSTSRQSAMNTLVQAEQRAYTTNPSTALLTQMQDHALQSGNAGLIMDVAQLQLKAGNTEQAVTTANQMLQSAGSLPAGQSAQLQLGAAGLLMAAGLQGAQITQALQDVGQYLNSAAGKQLTGDMLTMAAKYDALTQQTSATEGGSLPKMSPALESMVQQLGRTVDINAAGLAAGQQMTLPGMDKSAVLRTQNGFVMTQQGADGSQVSVTFEKGTQGTLDASRVEVKNGTGQVQQVYETKSGSMQLTQQRVPMQVEMPGGQPARVVDALLPVNRTDKVQTLANIEGKPYILTVGQDNQATAVIGHVPEADGSVFSQNLPTGRMQLNADGTITFTPLGGEAMTVQGKTIQSMADLDALGIKNGITSDLVGKTAFTLTLPGKGQVTFIGSLQDIQAGDYYVAGTNQLIAPKEGQQASTPYLAQYRGGTLAQVSLTDSFNTTIAYQSSDLAKFTVTQTSGDGQRVATMKYENNQLQGYGVEYKAFGVTLLYDAKGGLTPECMQYLRENSGKGYTLKYTGQGFSLTNNATGFEQFFSAQGRALLNPGKAGTTSGGAQEVMEFDVKQSVNFQVAKYDNGSLGSQAVHFDQISRQYVLLQASAEGVVNKTTITSDIAGKVNSRQVENLNMNQREAGTFSAKGELETGTRNLQAKVMEGRDDQTGNTVRRENVTSFERMENGKVVESTMHLGSLEVRTSENALVQRMTDVNYKNGDIVSAGVLETDKQKMTGVRFTNGNVSYAASLTSGEQRMTAVNFRADGSIESAATLTSGKQQMTGVQFRKDGSISYAATLASGEQRLTGVQFRTDGSISYAATLTSGEQSMTRVNFRADGSIESAATLTSGKQQMTDVRFRADGSLSYAATLTSGEQKMTQVNFRADGSIESAATLTSGNQHMTGVRFRTDGSLSFAATLKSGDQSMTGVEFRGDGSIQKAASLTVSGKQGVTVMTGVEFRPNGSISFAEGYKAGGQEMTRVSFRADGSIESAASMTIAGEKGAVRMTDVRFRADGSLEYAQTYKAGEQEMTGVNFRTDNSIAGAATLTTTGDKGTTTMTGVQFRTDGSLQSAKTMTTADTQMTGVQFRQDNSIEAAATVKSGDRSMYDVKFNAKGGILEAGRIEETIAKQDVKNDAGAVIGREEGVQRTLLNAKFDEAGNLVQATQKVTIATRTEFNAEKGETTVSRNIRSEARIEGGKVVESRTEVGSVQTRNAHNRIIAEQFNIVESLTSVVVNNKEIKVQINQTKDASQVTLNDDKGHPIAMGANVRVTTDGKALFIQDERGVLRQFSAEGKETTGWFRQRANDWHGFTHKVSVAWNTYVDRLVKLDNWVNSSTSVGQAAWRGFVRELGGIGSLLALGGSVILDASLSLVVQQVGAVLSPTLEWAINVSAPVQAINHYMKTGESLGAVAIDQFKAGVAAAFAPVDRAIQWAQEGILNVAEGALTKAELSDSAMGTVLWGAAATSLKILGENLPIVAILSLNALNFVAPGLGSALSSTLGTVLLAKDAVLNGLGHMYQAFFVDPVNKIAAGVSEIGAVMTGATDSALSTVRQVVNAAATIGSGVVGVMLAKQMVKGALEQARAARTDAAMSPAKNFLKAEVGRVGVEGIGAFMKGDLGKFMETAMKMPEGSTAKYSWSRMKLEDATFNTGSGRVSFKEMLTNKASFPEGASQIVKILTAKDFSFTSLEFSVPSPKLSLSQRTAAAIHRAMGREAKVNAEVSKPLTNIVKPAQIGQAFTLTGTIPAIRAFAVGFVGHQIQSFANIGRVMSSAWQGIRSAGVRISQTRLYQSVAEGVRSFGSRVAASAVMRLFAEPFGAARPGIMQALRGGAYRQAGSLALAAFRQVGTNMQKALVDLPQAVRNRLASSVTLRASGNAPRLAEAMGRTGMTEGPAKVIEAPAKQRALDTRTTEQGETAVHSARTVEVAETTAGKQTGSAEPVAVKGAAPADLSQGGKAEGTAPTTQRSSGQSAETKAVDAAAAGPKSAVAQSQTRVDNLQQALNQTRADLTSARNANQTAEASRLETRASRIEGALQRAQAQLFNRTIADLQVQKQAAAEIAADTQRAPVERQLARSQQVLLDGEIQMTKTKAQAAAVEGNLRSLEAKAAADPAVKPQVEALKKQLDGLRSDQALQQQRQEVTLRGEQAKVQQLELGQELAATRSAEVKAATTEGRQLESAKARRIEKEILQAKAQEQVAAAEQRVLDFQAEAAKAQTTRDFNQAMNKLAGAHRMLRGAQFDLADYQKQLERAAVGEVRAATNELLRQAASESGISSRALRQAVENVVKEQTPRGNREAVSKAIAELLTGKGANPEALKVLEGGTGSLQRVMESMARNGLQQQAMKILDQLCADRGINTQAERAALAQKLGLPAESTAGSKTLNPADVQTLMDRAFGTPRAADSRFSADAADALRSLGSDLKQGTSLEQAFRRSSSRLEQAFRQLEQQAGGRDAVAKLIENMTAQQAREVLTSTNPLETLKNIQRAQESQGVQMTEARTAQKTAGDRVTTAKQQAEASLKAVQEQVAAEVKARGETARQQAVQQRLGKADVEAAVQRAEAQARSEAAGRLAKAEYEGQQSVQRAEAGLTEAAGRVKALSGTQTLGEMMATNPAKAQSLLQRMLQVQEAGAAVRQATTKLNEAKTYAERQTAQKQLARAEQNLARMERLAELKPEAGAGRRIPLTAEWRANRQAGKNSPEALRMAYLKEMASQVQRMESLSAQERTAVQELIQNETQIAKLRARQEGWLARRSETVRNRIASEITTLAEARTEIMKRLTTNDKGEYTNRTIQKLLAAEGVSRAMMQESLVVSEGFGKAMVQLVETLRAQQKAGATQAQIDAALKQVVDQFSAGLEKSGRQGLAESSRTMLQELAKAFQADPKYQRFTADPKQLAFLSRILELHLLNLELGTKTNSLGREVMGEVVLLAMGGGKSAGVLSLVLAMEIYKANNPGKPVPATMYITATDTLVDQIVKDEPAFSRLEKSGQLVKVNKGNFAEIISKGLEAGKIYVFSNESLKGLQLEMRGQGWSDARIRGFFREVGTKSWDEFHSAFHTTDTILGSSGVWDYLPRQVQVRIEGTVEALMDMYVKTYRALQFDLAAETSLKDIFRDVDLGNGQTARNQKSFNLDYVLRSGEFKGQRLGDVLTQLGVDVSTSGGNLNIMRKMAQAMFNTNGREITGGVDAERGAWYGVGEKGVGRLNTIHGDPVLGAYQLIDILVKEMVRTGQLDPANFSSRKVMDANRPSVKSIGEALAHLTTERITMLEAMQLMGAHNIVGYTGTAKGLSRAMLQAGKQITTISDETIITMDEVRSGQVHFSMKLGDQILRLELIDGKVQLQRFGTQNYSDYLITRAMRQMRDGYSQQVFTHNDNTVLGTMASRLAQQFGVDVIKVTDATVEAHFRQMAPERTKGLDWAKDADRVAAMDLAIRDMLGTRSSRPQVVMIDGMTPESYQRAIESVKGAIHQMPKMDAVLKIADSFGPGLRQSLNDFIAAEGGVEKASVGKWLQTMQGTARGEAVARILMNSFRTECGWMQQRFVFAPAIGEGLNIFGAIDGLPNHMQFKGRLVKMDLSPTDVFAQAMKRGNVTDETTGAIKRVFSDTGLDLNLDRINGIKDVERARFQQFLDGVRTGKIDITSEGAQRQFFGLFDGMMRDYLVEIDVAKAGEVARTQAGNLPKTDAVTVEKGSPAYMRAMADKITRELPSRLREFQGLADLSASWNGRTPGSLLTRMPVMAPALRENAWFARIPGVSWVANQWASVQGALKTDGQQLALVRNLAETWQNPEITTLAGRITALQAANPANWREALVTEQLPAAQVTDLQAQYGAGWAQAALAGNASLERQITLAEQVAGYQSRFGGRWIESAMQERVGSNWSFYQRVNSVMEAKGPLQQLTMPLRLWSAVRFEPARARDSYFAALQNASRVAEKIPALQAEPETAQVTYEGETMALPQAQIFVRQQLAFAKMVANQYNLQVGETLKQIQQQADPLNVDAGTLQRGLAETLQYRNAMTRFFSTVGQKWQDTLRTAQRAAMVVPLFKVHKGWVVPTLPGTLVFSAAAVAALSVTGLPLAGLILGVAAGAVLQPVMSSVMARFAPAAGTSRTQSFVGKMALPALFLLGGVLLGQPMLVGNSLGTISAEVIKTTLRAPAVDKQAAVVSYRKPAAAETAGVQLDASQKAQTGKTLVETWKQEMYGLEGGDTAYNKLQDIIARPEFGQVRLTAAEVAQRYGYMHLLAAVLSLVPGALNSVSAIEVGTDAIQSPENVVDEQDVSRVRVDRGSVRFLDQRFSELLLTQAVTAAVMKAFPDAERATLSAKLVQSGRFGNDQKTVLVEFVKQYLMDGPALKAWLAEAAATKQGWAAMTVGMQELTLYQIVQQRFGGKEFGEADLVEINQAMGELENEAVPLMAEAAKQIQAEPAANRPARLTEFEARFGITYESYLAMANPGLWQRILLRVAGKEQLQGDQPVNTVRQFGWQVAGVGVAALAVGVVGILTGMLPAILGAAVALTGAAVVVSGLWTLFRAQAVAFSVNPSGTVAEQMRKAAFRSEQDQWAAQNKVNTLQLLETREFSQAVAGLRIKGTEHMLSEQNRGRAVRAVVGQMVRVMESEAPQELKLQLTKELTQVLSFLQFNFNMQVLQNGPALNVTLTPEAQPQALKQDYKLGRLVQRLEGLGIKINLELAPPIKQPKLKLTGAAA